MAIRDIFKISRKTFLNPSGWLDVDFLVAQTKSMWEILSGLFGKPISNNPETYEEALARMQLTDAEVQSIGTTYFSYAIGFLVLAIAVFIFSFYLLFHHISFSGWLLAIGASALFLGQAFRFHFWYFQIKHRKLGCTFEEWRSGKVEPEEPIQ